MGYQYKELQRDGILEDIEEIKEMIRLKTVAMNSNRTTWASEIATLELYLGESIDKLKLLGEYH